MNVWALGVMYVFIGIGCVLALVVRGGKGRASWVDSGLLLAFWPLFAPFVFARAEAPPPERPEPGGEQEAVDLLDALRRAGGTPLASLLPDIEAGRRLARRLSVAERHVREIDRLLEMPQYSEGEASDRQEALRAQGDARSAEMIDNRVQIIRRLKKLREQFSKEINQIEEILTQLQLQAELVRMAGIAGDDTRGLVLDLVTRIQGLEALMEDETLGIT